VDWHGLKRLVSCGDERSLAAFGQGDTTIFTFTDIVLPLWRMGRRGDWFGGGYLLIRQIMMRVG
jgi:hypothetical protein